MNIKKFSTFRTLSACFVVVLVSLICFRVQAGDGSKAYPSTAVEGLPYSGVVRAGDMIFVGAVTGTVPGGKELVAGGITMETRAALGHVKDMLELAGASIKDTVKCTVLLANIDSFPKMNAVFREFFPVNPPTRSTIIVPEIPMGAAMEIDCNAYKPD
jgi:2-iminobutanoate/2-iminopropanoate deaminase